MGTIDTKQAKQSEQTTKNEALLYALLLNERQASFYIGIEPTTLKISRVNGTLLGRQAPEYVRFGRTIRYKRDVLDKWVKECGETVTPTPKKKGAVAA